MPIVTLPGGELRDEIRQPLYDTVGLLAGQTLGTLGTENFFQTLVDENGNNKSLAETNLTQPGSLQTAVSFRVQGLSFDAQNDAIANVEVLPTLLNRSSLSFSVGVKNYWQGPARFAAGRETEYLMAGSGAATGAIIAGRTFQQYGWSAVQALVFQGKHVIDINPLQNFNVAWTTQVQDLTAAEAAIAVAAGTDMWFVTSLKGLLRRPVQ
jgi:hypothetical protein